VSVYLSVAPPDGFTKWADSDWERWLKEHPWEAAERVCSRESWAIFLYQVRQHAPSAKKRLETVIERLVNERPLSAREAEDLQETLHRAQDELGKKPAEAMKAGNSHFAAEEDMDALIGAARARLGKEPTLGDVWAEVFDQVDRILDNAIATKRGIYFGNA
jgi:hypothetical protein